MLLLMCVCLHNKSCTIINKNSKDAAKVWNYTNHSTAKKRPWRWTEYWIFQRKIMCLWVCVTWWNDCHGKLNLTLKEMSNSEKNHHRFSLYKKELYLFIKEFFSKPLIIVYDTCQLHLRSHMGWCKNIFLSALYSLGLLQIHGKGKYRNLASSNFVSLKVWLMDSLY